MMCSGKYDIKYALKADVSFKHCSILGLNWQWITILLLSEIESLYCTMYTELENKVWLVLSGSESIQIKVSAVKPVSYTHLDVYKRQR